MGYDNLVKKFGYSQETLSKILGKSRSHIANTLRLAGLPEEIKKMISDGLLKNKGYGTSKHMEGIKNYGISKWHRTTYGCCKEAIVNDDEFYKD